MSLTALPEITAKVRPPRAFAVPYALGFTMGLPGDLAGQMQLIRQALALVTEDS